MIVNALVGAVFSMLAGLISLLPSVVFAPFAPAIAGILSWISPWYAAADWIFPLHETAIAIVAAFSLRVSGLVVAVVLKLVSYIPFIGHGE